MYKVFINDSVIIFTNNKEIENKEDNFLKFKFFDANMIEILYQVLKKDSKLDTIYIEVRDVEKTFIDFKNHFKIIKAAGGTISTWDNKNAIKAGNILVSADKSIHKRMLKLLKPALK